MHSPFINLVSKLRQRSVVLSRDIRQLFAFLLTASLVSACVSGGPYDGPPRSGSNIPRELPGDAQPREEPRSRYGNGPYYKVRGRNYRVLDSSHGYQERGVASWYGKKFHGRMTSNQEPYDMYAMTAAHKTLPLPTYVRVRNLKNNRSIVVRVNDRGPFVDNRLIDLSYSAAIKLDMVKDGTGLVEVTAISFDEPVTETMARAGPENTPTAVNSTIFVQVGAFGDEGNARRRYSLLRKNGFRQAFVHKDESRNPALFRVRIGPIANVDQYDAIVERLQRIGIRETHLVTD
jgi:rare lipoprotein A